MGLANSIRSGRDLVEQVRFLAFRNWKTKENIAFEPPLPAWKTRAIHRLGMGNVAKVPLEIISSESSGSRIQVIDSNCPTFQPLT